MDMMMAQDGGRDGETSREVHMGTCSGINPRKYVKNHNLNERISRV